MTTVLTCSGSTSAYHWWDAVEAVRISHGGAIGYLQLCRHCLAQRITWWAPDSSESLLTAYKSERDEKE